MRGRFTAHATATRRHYDLLALRACIIPSVELIHSVRCRAHPWPSRWRGSGRLAGSIAVNRFALRAVASIVAGLALGAAAVLGVTLALQQDARAAQPQGDPNPSVSNLVEYGDRCFHGHCLPQCWHGHCLH